MPASAFADYADALLLHSLITLPPCLLLPLPARLAIAVATLLFFFFRAAIALPLALFSCRYAFDAAMLLMPAPPDAIAIISLKPPFLHAIICCRRHFATPAIFYASTLRH
jgi:hypothetical protein